MPPYWDSAPQYLKPTAVVSISMTDHQRINAFDPSMGQVREQNFLSLCESVWLTKPRVVDQRASPNLDH
jgi:hypothetical protein